MGTNCAPLLADLFLYKWLSIIRRLRDRENMLRDRSIRDIKNPEIKVLTIRFLITDINPVVC
jgi:hypothetical protein